MVKRGWLYLVLVILMDIVFLMKSNLTLLGLFVEAPAEKTWNFSNAVDYVYDLSSITLASGDAALVPTITESSYSREEKSVVSITSALLHNPGEETHDKTLKVESINGEFANLQKGDDVLDVTFEEALENGDVVSLYLLQKNNVQTSVYLCDAGTLCSAPGYGQVDFNGVEGWYNITLSGLSSPKTVLGIDPPSQVKVDYVEAVHTEVTEYTNTSTTYPLSAEIKTEDFAPSNLGNWQDFSAEEELNGQSITYRYSVDSGINWMDVPEDYDLSSVDSGSIRFKAILTSDGTGTPVLESFKLGYTTRVCSEDWECSGWSPGTCPINGTQTRSCLDSNGCGTEESKPAETRSCAYTPTCNDNLKNQDESDIDCGGSCDSCSDGKTCSVDADCANDCLNGICGVSCVEAWYPFHESCLANDTQLKFYFDQQGCGTKADMPSDNGTYVACDYCAPSWREINNTCWPGNTFTSWFNDTNQCFALTGLSSDYVAPINATYSCDYCALHDCVGSSGNYTRWENGDIEILVSANTTLELNLSAGTGEVPVTVIEYSHNLKDSLPEKKSLNRYLEIESGAEEISSARIIVHYTDEEVSSANVSEETLKIHYYNETSGEWQELDSFVNSTGNYVYASVSHLSFYGLFGEEAGNGETVINGGSGASASSSGGGGGGGSSNRRNSGTLNTVQVEESVKETVQPVFQSRVKTEAVLNEPSSAEPFCNYAVEVFLPDEISFLEKDSFKAEIVNRGDCEIPELSLQLSPEMEREIIIPTSHFQNLQPGNRSTFTLIRRQQEKKGVSSFFTGLAVANFLMEEKSIAGSFLVEAIAGRETVYKKDLGFTAIVKVPRQLSSNDLAWAFLAFGVLVFLFVFLSWRIFGLGKRRRKKEEKGEKKRKVCT